MAQPETTAATKPPSLVMQVILPKTLVTDHKWPTGPLMAQAAHAATAVLHENAELQSVKDYLSDLPNMRKTVMEVADEAKLREVVDKLKTLDPAIPYHLWIEQPENAPTALALVPNNRPKALKKILDQAGCRLWQ